MKRGLPPQSPVLKYLVFSAMFIEPVPALSVFREHLLHLGPEGGGMIHLLKMRQFVYNDVIDNLHRQHDDPPVKPETLPAAAAAPQRLL